jgi:shikimate dehydrogenase
VLRKELSDSDLLINATNVGMAPEVDRCLIPDSSFLPSSLAVADVIYNPAQTKLMKLAQCAGCKTFNGLYMLLYQGAEAFKIWTGREMPIEPIKQKYFS